MKRNRKGADAKTARAGARATVAKTDEYGRALAEASREYEALGRQRTEIDRRLAQLAQTMGSLAQLCGFTPTVGIGLTDACRLVLRGAGVPLTPVEVRDKLMSIGFDWSKYSNELASIHTILKRLNHAGEIRFISRGPGKDTYVWQRPPTSVVLSKAEIDALLQHRHAQASATDKEGEPK